VLSLHVVGKERYTHTNDLFGWCTSVVDGIDTAIVMGLTDIVEQQLKHIASVDFTYATNHYNLETHPLNQCNDRRQSISILGEFFDVNIRYLGG
jgi:mannosyl-oligosaccharide alpha-1,2-mannosidase